MKYGLAVICLLFSLAVPVSALEIEAPPVPEGGQALMPEKGASFSEGLTGMAHRALAGLVPDLKEACAVSTALIGAVLLTSMVETLAPGSHPAVKTAAALGVGSLLLTSADTMIRLADTTVTQMSDYGKLLLPVMTAALAAQGGAGTSAGLYAGTAFFSALTSNLLSRLFVPLVYLFLALSIAAAAVGEDILKKLKDMLKNAVVWCLKTVLTVFTTYMSITGVVSGTTDAAALKAAKVTISSFVPVVGGILSDASEAVIVGAGVMKNAAGIYGIFAVLSLFLGPFLRIGSHYLILKLTALVCAVFSEKSATGVIEDVSSAMGLLLGITGAMCLLLLISTVCFMKGVSI